MKETSNQEKWLASYYSYPERKQSMLIWLSKKKKKEGMSLRNRDVVELIRSGNHLELGVKERQWFAGVLEMSDV